MKKLLAMFTIMAFAAVAPYALAENAAKKSDKTAKKINCCVKGDCKELTRADCKKAKGKVVKDCKDCKPPKSSKPKM